MPRSEMMETFFQDAHEALGNLEAAGQALQQDTVGDQDQVHMGQMLVLSHRLRGTAGLYGFPQLSSLAGVAERLLESRPQLPAQGRQQFVSLMSRIIELLRAGLNYLDVNGKELQLGLEFSAAGGTAELQKLVYAYPQAFKPYSAAKQFHEQQLREEMAAAAEQPLAQPVPAKAVLEQQLRDFYKDNSETWEYYAPEVREHLEVLREQLASGSAANIDVMFRAAHTIKGSSYMVGFTPLGDFAHKLEDLLGAVREGVQPLAGNVEELLQEATDTAEHYLKVAEGDTAAHLQGTERLQAQLNHMAAGEPLETFTSVSPDAEPQVAAAQAPQAVLEQQLRDFYKDNSETWEYYAPEVREHLEVLREQLASGSAANIDVMFRAAHTIKGSSYMVGFTPLGDFAHKLEDLLGAVREGVQPLAGNVEELLQEATDTAEHYLKVAEGDPLPLEQSAQLLQGQMEALVQGETLSRVIPAEMTDQTAPAVAPAITTVRVRAEQLDGLMAQVGDLVVARSQMTQAMERLYALERAMGDSQSRFQRTVRDFEERYLNPDMVRLGQDTEAASSTSQASAQSSLRSDINQQFNELEFDTYSDLNILARSMTELSADFAELRTRFIDGLNELSEENEDMSKLIRRLRLDISRTSRVPFAQAVVRLRRWARDHSEFVLSVTGENLEIENSVLQNLNEPLLHLLTNAVYHGIGAPEERAAQGKDPLGHVRISAQELGSFLEVSVEDDGRGLDLEAIRIRALERGQRSAQELAEMSDDELARLILLPGLSTAKSVSTTAGRGVGMDVVASSMRRLGGDLLIRTQRGKGTRITLRVPTSQQIIDVLQVRMGQQMVGFATSVIQALREVHETDLAVGDEGMEVLDNGQWISILDMRQMWGLPPTDDTWKLLILRSVSGNIAVRVDDFDRIEEVALSPLSGLLRSLDYITATTVATTGEVLPVIDPTGLLRLHTQPDRWLGTEQGLQKAAVHRRILLVDDSLSVRRLVSRMLERGGYEVQTANDGQEAFELLQFGLHFDLVVTDLEMPRMNGYELLEAVRGRQAIQHLPMVVMTTRAGDKHQRLAFQLGANDYFSKPVDEALLLRRLNKILEEQKTL